MDESIKAAAYRLGKAYEYQGFASCKKTIERLKAHYRDFETRAASLAASENRGTLQRSLTADRYRVTLACQSALAGMKRVKYSRLPLWNGQLRIEKIGQALLHDRLTPEGISDFLAGFQQAAPLQQGELALLVPVLNACCVAQAEQALRQGSADRFCCSTAAMALLQSRDLSDELERNDLCEQTLRQDPAGIYPQMDRASRSAYKNRLSREAARCGLMDIEAAQLVVQLARQGEGLCRHVGYYIRNDPLGRGEKKNRPAVYYAARLGLRGTLALGCTALSKKKLFSGVLGFLSCRSLADGLLGTVWPKCTDALPALDTRQGLGEKTLVVITCLLQENNDALADRLRRIRLGCHMKSDRLLFGLLADFPDSNAPDGAEEEARIKTLADRLNRSGDGSFFLFHRPRIYHEKDGLWRGEGRKCGAIAQLMTLLTGGDSQLLVAAGREEQLHGTAYVLTLDEDTEPYPGSIGLLIGTITHPLNRPVIKGGTVVSGYGIIQPRLSLTLESTQNAFAQAMGGSGGHDPYGDLAADRQQAIFGSTAFSGKGILSVEAYAACVLDVLPRDRVLSHDIVEGELLRTGRQTRACFFESFPKSSQAYLTRQARWVRGDWQNLPFLLSNRALPGREPLGFLSRIRLLENLCRSLTPLWTAAAAIKSEPAPLLLGQGTALLRLVFSPRQRNLSRRLTPRQAAALTVLLRLTMAPAEAVINGKAAVTALYRLWISGKNLLQWQTAARSGENGQLLPEAASLAVGAALLMGGSVPFGLLWLFADPIRRLTGRQPKQPQLSADDRAFLMEQAAAVWGYFCRYAAAEYGYLIPDNVQISPRKGAALRTSPTNIGLMLLSCLAALDLELEQRQTVLTIVSGCLDTVEKLEKKDGQLYNWYDLRTMTPLPPRSLSSVDSGNLCGCLIALSQGLSRLGEKAAAQRAMALADSMDFAVFYRPEKHLLAISREENGQNSESCYDFLESEARQTGFLAVALGQIPTEHWTHLSRTVVKWGRRQGMGSWSGTMFEYLMPRLLMEEPEGSALHESGLFCLAVQRGRGRQLWGVSESGYCAFDETLDYRYKASGVQPLAFCPHQDRDRVIAPYASYLALSVDKKSSVRNLRRLAAAGMAGEYGLYEAIDLTPGRAGAGDGMVKSYMAHHMGMSLVAIDNALNDNIMVRRFMSYEPVAAHRLLLQEQLPYTAHPIDTTALPQPPGTPGCPDGESRCTGMGNDRREAAILSNGYVTALADRQGRVHLRCAGYLTLQPGSLLFWLEDRGKRQYLTPYPAYEGDYCSVFHQDRAEFHLKTAAYTAKLTLFVLRREAAFMAKVTVDGSFTGRLCCGYAPVLDRAADYGAHPAFSRLFVVSEITSQTLVSHRRGSDAPCLAVRAGGEQQISLPRQERCQPNPALFSASVALRDEKTEVTYIFAMGESQTDCAAAARELLHTNRLTPSARQTDFFAMEGTQGFSLSSARLLAARLTEPENRGALAGRSALYAAGISGDLPVVCAQEKSVREQILNHRFLAFCGVAYDLVLFVPEEGYDRPKYNSLISLIATLDCEGELSKRGGIHIAPENKKAVLCSLADAVTPLAAAPVGIQPEKRPVTGAYAYRQEGENEVLEGLPPRVWACPLASERFGTIAADCGLMGSWHRNARENRFTPWDNAPFALEGSERLTIARGGERYSAFSDGDGRQCRVTFARGAVTWEKQGDSCRSTVTAFVPFGGCCRLLLVTLEGENVSASLQVPVILGASDREGKYVRLTETENGFRGENRFNEAFPHQWALVLCAGAERTKEENRAILTVHGSGSYVFLTGCAETEEEERQMRGLLEPKEAERQLTGTLDRWRQLTGRLQIQTGIDRIDRYFNNWCLYQVIASRLWGRCSVYQCGGAYGMRDQLQDVCALIYTQPQLTRKHILKAAAMQFPAGDCAHWWHELSGGVCKGVRTRCSDDYLWLCYAVCRYVKQTGDKSILDERVPYLQQQEIPRGKNDIYIPLVPSTEQGTVLDHCRRAAQEAIRRGTGQHGLPFMGSGDWNDGMDKVGGESLWLAFFMAHTFRLLEEYLPGYAAYGDQLVKAAEESWDGAWYRRGYFADGEPLGSMESLCCKIDAIAQGFAPLALAQEQRVKTALESAANILCDEDNGIVKLFTPAFTPEKGQNPGYLASYPEGVRENGGQYTHGALWLAMGLFEAGMAPLGEKLLTMLAPGGIAQDIYQAEPFVIAADVSAAQGQMGRAGWTWYTGSAGWFYTITLEQLLGVDMEDGKWVKKHEKSVKSSVTLDGRPIFGLQEKKKNV